MGVAIVYYILGAICVLVALIIAIPALIMGVVTYKHIKNKLTLTAKILSAVAMGLVLLAVLLWGIGIIVL